MQETIHDIVKTSDTTVVYAIFLVFILLAGMIVVFVFFYQQKRQRYKEQISNMQATYEQSLLQSKVEIQRQTLQEVAAELHDNFTPTLSIINLNLASIAKKTEEPVKGDVLETKEMVKGLAADMKKMSVELNAEYLEKIGFVNALRVHLEKIEKTGAFKAVQFSATGDVPGFSSNNSLVLLRICQEALNNIVKHAEASDIHVAVHTADGVCKISIGDNGRGFDIKIAEHNREDKESTGLLNLQRRATAIGAELQISSKPGLGTRITILLNA